MRLITVLISIVFLMGCGVSNETTSTNTGKASEQSVNSIKLIYTEMNFSSSPEEIVTYHGKEPDTLVENALGGNTYDYNYTGALGKETSRISYNFDASGRLCYIDWDFQTKEDDDYAKTMSEVKELLIKQHGSTVNEADEAFYWLDNDVNIRLLGMPVQSFGGVIHCTYYEPNYFEEWQSESN